MFMPRALSESVNQIACRTTGKDWNLYAALLRHWQEIVGTDYARVTTPVKITFPHQPNEARRSKGILRVRLPKGLVMEFNFKTDIIRQRINVYFGYEAITRITFEPVYEIPVPTDGASAAPDPAALARLHEMTNNVQDETLRIALENFGEAMLARQATEAGKSAAPKSG